MAETTTNRLNGGREFEDVRVMETRCWGIEALTIQKLLDANPDLSKEAQFMASCAMLVCSKLHWVERHLNPKKSRDEDERLAEQRGTAAMLADLTRQIAALTKSSTGKARGRKAA